MTLSSDYCSNRQLDADARASSVDDPSRSLSGLSHAEVYNAGKRDIQDCIFSSALINMCLLINTFTLALALSNVQFEAAAPAPVPNGGVGVRAKTHHQCVQ